jgi:hypothetical protein
MQTESPKADPPKRKRRWFQFSLRTLMIGVTVFCVVIGGYTVWQKKIVKERQEWLHAHSRQPDLPKITGLRIGDDKQRPGLIRCWLGDEPQEYLKLENPAHEEIEAAHQLFPEANFFMFWPRTQTSGH